LTSQTRWTGKREHRYKYIGDNGEDGRTWRWVETITKTGETYQGVTRSLPYCWLRMIYNWAHNSPTSKEYEQMYKCALVAKCSSRFDFKTRASTHDRLQCKNSPFQSE
jgi:hypothetical protein